MGEIIEDLDGLHASLWLTKPSRGGNTAPGNQGGDRRNEGGKGGKAGGKAGKGKASKGAGKGGKEGGKGKGDRGNNAGIKTCRQDSSGKNLCKMYNDARGCTRGASCFNKHTCDVLMATGQNCDGNHPRATHRGATIPL